MNKTPIEKRDASPESLRFTSDYSEDDPPELFRPRRTFSQRLSEAQICVPERHQTQSNTEELFGPSLPEPIIYTQDPALQLRLSQANSRRNVALANGTADHRPSQVSDPLRAHQNHEAMRLSTLQAPTVYGYGDEYTATNCNIALTRSRQSNLTNMDALSMSADPKMYRGQNIYSRLTAVPTVAFQTQSIDPAAQEGGFEETKEEFKIRLTNILEQMMFVSGETAESSTETTWMIEEIVREQVVEMLKEATILANRRGSKSIAIVDLIFQIRHNAAKVSRLKTFLSWKDVRKNVKDSDDKAGGADADALDLDDAAVPGANPSAPQKSSTNKKAKLILPWEVQSFYSEQVPEREDEEDEEEEEQNEATLARLASADERTRNMTRKEYVYWSECRQASFTFRKGKRFKEWAGFGTIIDSKPNDDVVDILGFLTFEIVQTLTEEALKVKAAEDLANKKASGGRGDIEATKKRKREGCTLFEMPEEGRTPVEPKHVREAFRRLQIVPPKYKFMRQGYAGIRTPLRMI